MTEPEEYKIGPIRKSTIQLLRFHFSFFLMPVYWFALSQIVHKDLARVILIFFILHFLVYPASNGYNSFMDRDESSIGGLKKPLMPTRQLYFFSLGMDALALLLGFFVSPIFAMGILAYISASRAYSFRGIRLKKYPVIGYLTVVIFQGALVFFLVYHGASDGRTLRVPAAPMLASALLVGGFYPLTQIYQHESDRKDGIKSISALLGYRGTFIFSMITYLLAFIMLAWVFISNLEEKEFLILATCLLPILVYFLVWAFRVWKNEDAASFENTMKMNILASCCTNLGFIIVMLAN